MALTAWQNLWLPYISVSHGSQVGLNGQSARTCNLLTMRNTCRKNSGFQPIKAIHTTDCERPMVREGSREAVALFLEASALYRALDSSSDEEDSENEWEDPRVLHDILTARYWQRRSVAKFCPSDELHRARFAKLE
ncbi:unnamed protein product [Phytophthora fragariaefolia]|uniref:Unnamed protein product n=1 Tax=Phytophthora fragariaefolia TaxID=1490495 RepID=A0A9W6WTW5_9STRA|nr:unnamed protein product [Phytophthora fragariaefolia]